MKAFVVVMALSVTLAAAPAFAQVPAGAPAPAKPAPAPAAPAAAPPVQRPRRNRSPGLESRLRGVAAHCERIRGRPRRDDAHQALQQKKAAS